MFGNMSAGACCSCPHTSLPALSSGYEASIRISIIPSSEKHLAMESAPMKRSTDRLRLAVLVSGSGTTLQNLLDRSASGRLPAQVVLVVSSNPEAFALERARRAGVATAIVSRKEAGSPEEFSRRIFDHCRAAHADLVCMAGFLQLIRIPDDFLGRVLNI